MRSKSQGVLRRWRSLLREENALPLLSIMVLAIAVRLPFTTYTADDAYITFRYARNIASGLGFVYNTGEHVLGTTTPLYTLFLAFSGCLGLDLMAVGKYANILADAGSCALLYLLLRDVGPYGLAWAGAGLFLISPSNIYWSAAGMETGLYVFLILLTLFLYTHDRMFEMGLTAGVLTLIRPDGWLVVAAIGVAWLVQRKGIIAAIRPTLLLISLQVPWILFASWYFGSPIPNSILAKAHSYRAPDILHWVSTFVQIFGRGGVLGSILIGIPLFVGLASVLVLDKRRHLIAFAIWFMIYLGIFTLARAGPYPWYFAPPMPVLFLFLCLGAYDMYREGSEIPLIGQALGKVRKRRLAVVLIPALLLATGISIYGAWEAAQVEGGTEQHISRPIGIWLRDNTPSDSTIALESIGAVGWYSNRYIVDEGGLVSKETLALSERTPEQINLLGILQSMTPDYYVAWQTWELETLIADPSSRSWLLDNYEELQKYSDGRLTWVLFKRRGVRKN